MLPITERSFLVELRDTARGMCVANLNPDWVRAYEALGDAADWLDAMTARCTCTTEDVDEPSSKP